MIYLIHKRDKYKAADVLVKRAKEEKNIKFITDTVIQELLGEPLEGMGLKNVVSGEQSELKVDGLFIAVGALPN